MPKTGKEALKMLEERYKKQNQFIKDNYDRISITVPKGTKQWIKENTGMSCNAFFNELFAEYKNRIDPT